MNQAENLKYKLEYLDSCGMFEKKAAAESVARTAVAIIEDLETRMQKLEGSANA